MKIFKYFTTIPTGIPHFLERVAQYANKDRHSLLTIALVIWTSSNVMIALISDVSLELLSMFDMIYYPLRLDFISLIAIAGLLAWQSVRGIYTHNLRLTRNVLYTTLVIQLSLLLSDIHFVRSFMDNSLWVTLRLPFIIVNTLNIVLYVILFRFHQDKESQIDPHLRKLARVFNRLNKVHKSPQQNI
jgi:hypothetical protein